MNNPLKILLLSLLITGSMICCGCHPDVDQGDGGLATQSTVETTVPTTTASVLYQVTVVDEAGNPIAGAMVQLCKDTQCFPGVTNDQGVASYSLTEDGYKVSFMMLPEGFTYVDEMTEFFFEEGSKELTIVLKRA